MKFPKNKWWKVTSYLMLIVFLLIGASVSLHTAVQRTAQPIEENYAISIVQGQNDSVDFSGRSIGINLSLPYYISTSSDNENGISIVVPSISPFPLLVTEISASSAPGTNVYVTDRLNISSNKTIGNDSSASTVDLEGEALANYIDSSYTSGELSIVGSNMAYPIEGGFVYNKNYSSEIRSEFNNSYGVVSRYCLTLNESGPGKYFMAEDYFTLSLNENSSNNLPYLVMNCSRNQSFKIVMDNNPENNRTIDTGAVWITGFKTLSLKLVSLNSITLIPYDFVNGIDIPYSRSPVPTISILSNKINLTNTSGVLTIKNGFLEVSSEGGIMIQTNPTSPDSFIPEIGIYAITQSASAALNGSNISLTYVTNEGRTVFYSALAGALISAAIGMILDPIRYKIWPKK